MYNKEIFKDIIKQSEYVFAVKDKGANLEINTSYVMTGSGDFFTLYLVEDIQHNFYITDGAWILDHADEIDIDKNFVVKQASTYNLTLDERKFTQKVDTLNVVRVIDTIIDFAQDLGIIE